MKKVKRCLKVIISLGFLAVTRLCGYFSYLFNNPKKARCVVLYYHSIPVGQRQRFARQMDILLRWAKPVRADIMDPLPVGQNYAAITFDDGFQSVAANALPELEKRRIPATIFVVTGCLGSSPGWVSKEDLASWSETTMTAEHLRALPRALVTLGSHTVSHPRLTRLSADEARREIQESRRQLGEIANGQPVTLFSFPYGLFSPELVRLCGEAGYQRVFTTEPSHAFSKPRDFFTGRVSVDATDWPLEFWLKLLGCYRWHATVSAVKRKVFSVGSHPEPAGQGLQKVPKESTIS